jgi:predicted dehydrogenase
MSQNQIKWGILGTSPISEVMANAIHASSTSQLVAIASRSQAIAKEFSHKFSIPKFYGDYRSLLDDQEIDAVYIGLPNHLHKEWIIRTAEARKHILCEKPLVVSVNDAHEVISVVRETSVFCLEALMYRYHPFTHKLQELIQQQILGEIKLYNATYTANIADLANPTAGGSIRNLGCYPVSLIRLLTNAEPIELCAMGRLSPKNQTDNQGSAILKFADHSIAVVSTADDIDMFWQFDVYGTKGSLKVVSNPWKPDYHNKLLIRSHDEKAPIEINITADKPLYTYQIDTMNSKIQQNKMTEQNILPLLDSLGNTMVLEEWLQHVKTRKLQLSS